MSGFNPKPLLSSLVLLGLLLAGCGDSSNTPSLGDWTLKTDGVTLTEDLRVSETEAFYFGGIADVAVRTDGQIAVADHKANDVKVLTPDGALAHRLGQQGRGPGEFQRVGVVQWARGDSLFAYDLQASRLTVFAPVPPLPRARTVSVSREDGFPMRVYVTDPRLIVEISSRVPPSDGDPRYRRVRSLSEGGVPGDTLFTARREESIIIRNDGVFQFRPLPFARESRIALSPTGRLYAGYEDSLRIVAHEWNDTQDVIADVPAPPVPLTDADRDSALAAIDNDQMRQAVAKALPDTKPAFTDLVVADDGHLWVRRPPKNPTAETTAWWVLAPETKTIRTVQLPREVNIEVVQKGKAYGTTTTEVGAPALVRYRIQTGS